MVICKCFIFSIKFLLGENETLLLMLMLRCQCIDLQMVFKMDHIRPFPKDSGTKQPK